MKKLFTILVAVFLTATLWAQSPEKMSYQAVIRDASDNLITDTQIGMQISILQGSASGTAVYVETKTPTTNANGLVNIEIGAGTVVSGDFTAIDWANGPYFIKTETAVEAPLTTYTITGTSQLLSVPFALHAKTAESVTGGGSGSRYVGELFGGGVVFWVDHTGQHGLIVSMVDLSISQAWSNVTRTLIGTTNDWDGANNTTAIIEQSGHTSSAAQLCANYTNADYGTGTYSDWYLPSVAELNHIWNNFYEVQKALTNDGNSDTTFLVRDWYWSSSEGTAGTAWYFLFGYGDSNNYNKSDDYRVRAVRAF
jgi:hypothetical protein